MFNVAEQGVTITITGRTYTVISACGNKYELGIAEQQLARLWVERSEECPAASTVWTLRDMQEARHRLVYLLFLENRFCLLSFCCRGIMTTPWVSMAFESGWWTLWLIIILLIMIDDGYPRMNVAE